MKAKNLPAFKRSYLLALRKHLGGDAEMESVAANKLGQRALAIGLETLDLAKVHEAALSTIVPPDVASTERDAMILRAGKLFAEANTPIELTHRSAREGTAELKDAVDKLTKRTKELSESNAELLEEIDQRKTVEESLRTSEQTSSQLLRNSLQLQEELRQLSRRLLSVQEDERKRISRDLHDLIAQTLTGINLELAALKSRTSSNAEDFRKEIERTQRMVEISVNMVHQFARDLRPTLLDDLGLIPALKSHLKGFMEDTGIRVKLTAFADVEKLTNGKRTVLYRIAQEALNNIKKHAGASLMEVKIHQRNGSVCMEIHDNGKGFEVGADIFFSEQSKRLGLLGMRERVEMVDGRFFVKSNPGKGTTVCVEIPRLDSASNKRQGRKPARSPLKTP